MEFLILILAVLIGAISVLITKPSKQFIQILLTFSGAYLLSVAILHLLPEVYEANNHSIGVFILLGIFIQSILENFSKGVEHGHVHSHNHSNTIPWLLLISLGLHAFFEGIPLSNGHNHSLLWAIFIHKIPISIVLTTFLIQSKLHKIVIISIVFLFSIMSPLGFLLSDNLSFFTKYLTELTAIIIGIFLHISTIILFETSENHSFNIKKLFAILLGFGIAFLSL